MTKRDWNNVFLGASVFLFLKSVENILRDGGATPASLTMSYLTLALFILLWIVRLRAKQ